MRAYAKLESFRVGSRFHPWLYTIALNLCRDQARRRKRWGLILTESRAFDEQIRPAEPATSGTSDPSRNVERSELSQAVYEALEEISADQREVLILKEFEGLKFKEIAAILDCPERTVKSRMYYGLSGLRSVLARRGIRQA